MFCYCFTAIQKIHSDMLITKKLAFADGILINFNTQWKAYLLLCNYYKINPFNFSNTCSMFIFILTQPKYICTEQNNKIKNTTQITKTISNTDPLKIVGEPRCSRKVSSSCFILSDEYHYVLECSLPKYFM